VCAYCLLPFGTIVRHKGHNITQLPRGDHFAPFALVGQTRTVNLVAACQICNGLKSATLFENIEHAQRVVLATRDNRHYVVTFVPTRAITLDHWGWASEFARHLIDG
jgi:5-methylcytosine-specific restriction endonuclease McrA